MCIAAHCLRFDDLSVVDSGSCIVLNSELHPVHFIKNLIFGEGFKIQIP